MQQTDSRAHRRDGIARAAASVALTLPRRM